jgi:hypothetical protein
LLYIHFYIHFPHPHFWALKELLSA